VESGIPVIVALKDNATGHAVLFVGHENIADGLRTGAICRNANVGSGVVDTGDFDKRYIVVDDNYPPYQVCTFDRPTDYYSDPAFKKLHLAAFVVPLYPRIHGYILSRLRRIAWHWTYSRTSWRFPAMRDRLLRVFF